ncbi:MAG: hypothetical protein WDO14_08580 [Bacteroidota bacterium]
MNAFFQILLSNSPVLITILGLSVIFMWQFFKVDKKFDLLKSEMDKGFSEAKSQLSEVNIRLENKITSEIKDVRTKINDLRKDMEQQGKDIRSEMKDLGKDLRSEMKEGFTKRDHELEKTLTTLKVSRKDDPTPN